MMFWVSVCGLIQWLLSWQQSVIYWHCLIFRQHARVMSTIGWKSETGTSGDSRKWYVCLHLNIILVARAVKILSWYCCYWNRGLSYSYIHIFWNVACCWSYILRVVQLLLTGVLSNGQADIPRKKPRKQLLWVLLFVNVNCKWDQWSKL